MPCRTSDISLVYLETWDLDNLPNRHPISVLNNKATLPPTQSNAETFDKILATCQSDVTTVIFAVQYVALPESDNILESFRSFIHDEHESYNPRSQAEQDELSTSAVDSLTTVYEAQCGFHDFLCSKRNVALLQDHLHHIQNLRKVVISKPDFAPLDYYLYDHADDLFVCLVVEQQNVILQLFGIFADLLERIPTLKLELSFLDRHFPIRRLLADDALLSRLSGLKHLHLSFCLRDVLMGADATSIAHEVAALLAHLPHLESLSLTHESIDVDEGCEAGDQDIIAILLQTVRLPMLKALKIRRLMFRYKVVMAFVQRHRASLRMLNVYAVDVLPDAEDFGLAPGKEETDLAVHWYQEY